MYSLAHTHVNPVHCLNRREKETLNERIAELEAQIVKGAGVGADAETPPEIFQRAVAEAEARFLTKFEQECVVMSLLLRWVVCVCVCGGGGGVDTATRTHLDTCLT
jgi:hypothetical protein